MAVFGSGKARQAMATATMRAVETYSREDVRLYEDHVAIDLLPPLWQAFVRPLRFSLLRRPMLWYRDRQFPGIIGNLICRTRFIDDVLQASLRDGAEQVVILGAGFDTRAYRIPGIEDVTVFEVDHPDAQDQKIERLHAVYSSTPSHVTFVPIDFDEQALLPTMERAGFDVDRRTAVVWEGVTQYISATAVDSIFRTLSESGIQGKIVFTYIKRNVVEGTNLTTIDRKILDFAARSGTPWIFGIDPANLESYLAKRGLSLLEQVGPPDYRERYLDPVGREINLYNGERAAVAEIRRG